MSKKNKSDGERISVSDGYVEAGVIVLFRQGGQGRILSQGEF